MKPDIESSAAMAQEAGERSETAGGDIAARGRRPSPHAKPKKRSFTTEYKLRILEEADRANLPGQVAFLLRREGLYSSHLSNWRRWREKLESGQESPNQKPNKGATSSTLRRENERLQRQNQQLQKKLKHANLLIELQKKLNQTMVALHDQDDNEN